MRLTWGSAAMIKGIQHTKWYQTSIANGRETSYMTWNYVQWFNDVIWSHSQGQHESIGSKILSKQNYDKALGQGWVALKAPMQLGMEGMSCDTTEHVAQ